MDFRSDGFFTLYDAENEYEYVVGAHDDPAPPVRRINGVGNRLLSKIRDGKAFDNARRASGSTARDADPNEFNQDSAPNPNLAPMLAPEDASLGAAVRMFAAVQRYRLLPPASSTRVDDCECQSSSDTAPLALSG